MSILRACSPTLAAVLADGNVPLARADLFTFVLQDGTTTYRFTSWSSNLTVGGNVFISADPFLTCSGFRLTKTMTVPQMTIELLNSNITFSGGEAFKAQLRNGLFDGATILRQTLFMQLPLSNPPDTSLGTIDVFAGLTGKISCGAVKTVVTCKGKNNLLDQYVPRNVYQLGCNHAFCDPGCTLSRAAFTTAYTVGASPTTLFLPWSSAPSTPSRYQLGSVHMTSGPANGNWRTIVFADSSGLVLAYPLSALPIAGDNFTAFEGCDKTTTRCSALSNLQHFRGFPFVPPPDTAF